MTKYLVRRRKWPFHPPLQRPWELIRNSDGKPVGFYATELEAEGVRALAEAGKRGIKAGDLIKEIHRTGTMRGQ